MEIALRLFLCLGIFFTVFLVCSCSSIPDCPDNEPIQDQLTLVSFLEDIINSDEDYSVDVLTRKTISHRVKKTKYFIHTFYFVDMNDKGYHTLSFCGMDKKLYTDGMWVLNKNFDVVSYRYFTEGNNLWDIDYLHTGNTVDAYQTIKNVIEAAKVNVKYYYKDHIRSRQNSLNCNSAVNQTIVFKQ